MRWLWRLFADPEIRIDLRRVNDEDRAERRRAVFAEDLAYRARVKRRMVEGLTSEQFAPLIDTRAPQRQKTREAIRG